MKLEIAVTLLVMSYIANVVLIFKCSYINKRWREFAEQINDEWYCRNKKLIEIIKSLQEKIAEYERKDRE